MDSSSKYNTDDFNSLPIEDINKIKVLSLYDFIFENKEKIEKENYGVGLISKTFGLKKVEIATYLKPVCNLSQKLGTDEVCEILYNIKERMQDDESKKKKPSIQEIQYSHYLKDDRLNDIIFDSPFNETKIETEHKKEVLEEESFSYPKNDSDVLKTKDEEFQSENVISKKSNNVEDLLKNVDEKIDSFVPNNEDIIEEEDELTFDIQKELIDNDIEYEKEEKLSFTTDTSSKAKKTLFKKVLIGVGASTLIAGSLYGTFTVLLGGGDSSNSNVALQNMELNNNAQAVVIPPIEMPTKDSKPNLQIQMPNSNIENVPKFPVVEEQNDARKIETPEIKIDSSEKMLNSYSNVIESPNYNEKRTNNIEDIEKTLQVIMNKLNALEEDKRYEDKNNSSFKGEAINNTPNIKTTPIIEFKNVADFEKKFKEFKFKNKTFEFKGVTISEGDTLGNIKIEYIIPDVHIRIWDIKEGYPFVKVIK